jgi:predicted transcriptional regulator
MRKRNIKHFLAKPKGRLENTDTNMTFSMTRGTAARLNEIARAENKSLQQLLAIAVDEWLARRSDSFDATAAEASCGCPSV